MVAVAAAAVVVAAMGDGAHVASAATDTCAPSRLVVVLDRSSSMTGDAGDGIHSKWEAARDAVDQVASSYGGSVRLGLATFPYPDECGPGRLDVPPALDQRQVLAAALAEPPPEYGAWTPLAETLWALAEEPALTDGEAPTYVVIVSDGFQWCAPYDPESRGLPVVGVEALRDAGVTSFVVGFGGGVDPLTLSRMAVAAGTEQTGCAVDGDVPGAPPCYYQADDPGALVAALMDIAAVTSEETCDGLDNDCDGDIDEDGCPGGEVDAGVGAGADAADPGDDGDGAVPGGCGCAVGATAGAGEAMAGAAVFGLALLALLRRRRRGPRRRRGAPADRPLPARDARR